MADHLCPVWVGYLLASPLRKLLQNPKKILSPHVQEGMAVLDVGCAMGFFSLPLARMVGPRGKVICLDMQEKMLNSLMKRALKAGLSERIEPRVCRTDSLCIYDIPASIDFALASAVIHEVPDRSAFFRQVFDSLKPSGRLLVCEPKGHVSANDFQATVSSAEKNGFTVVNLSQEFSGHNVLLQKP